MICQFCSAEWTPRVAQPKECPYCHRYLVDKLGNLLVPVRLSKAEIVEAAHELAKHSIKPDAEGNIRLPIVRKSRASSASPIPAREYPE